MNASVMQARLRSGLDPNGSFAAVLRYPENWREAEGTGASWNARRRGLELTPHARPDIASDWLPLAPVRAADGTLYRADPETGRILRKAACDTDYRPLPGLGGSGPATGRFHTPAGVALDSAGRLFVADSGNSRVQVIDLGRSEVAAVLSDGLVLPVHMALDADGTVYVADAGTGAIHVFSGRFQPCAVLDLATLDPDTGTPWTVEPWPRPLAVTLLGDGTLAAFDPSRPMLWHMTREGSPLPAQSWFDAADMPEGWSPAARRFDGSAELVVGPIDGGLYDLAWHQVEIEADLPEGTSIEVQTFAANDRDDVLRAWAPRRTLAARAPRAEARRLVLPDDVLWQFWRLGRTVRDRPPIARLEGTGPDSADLLTLPRAATRRLRAGDTIRLRTDAGGDAVATVASVGGVAWAVSATGAAAAFAAPAGVRLIARDGRPLPYGPVDLGFLGVAGAPIALARHDGRPVEASLPAALATLIEPDDVLEIAAGDGVAARIEIIGPRADMVEVRLTEPTIGDFSDCTVHLEDTPGRLVLREDVPLTGPLPPGATMALVADARTEQVTPVWGDGESRTIWLTGMPPDLGAGRSWAALWTNAQFPEPDATDRGRFLWLRLRLAGRGLAPPGRIGPPVASTASPLLKNLRIVAPRYNLLGWLPPLYARHDPEAEPPGANFLERFLTLFEGHLTDAEAAFDSISRLLNPRAADAAWLDFVAGWLDLVFDPSWPIAQRRQLVIEAAGIQAAQGTPASLRRYLEIYTGHAVAISEEYLTRPPEPIQLGARGALGIAPLGGGTLARDRAHRFRATVTLPGHSDRRTEVSAIRGIIERTKPAHTDYTLDTDGARAPRVGMGARVGAIAIPGPGRTSPCTCDPDAPPSDRPQPGTLAGGGFRLGGRLGGGPVSDYRPQGG